MKEDKSSYRNIFKATFIFGGVQAFNILIGIIKNKIIAVLLGTTGLGILGLLTSAVDLIKVSSGLGLSQSAVRDLSESRGTGDSNLISRTIIILRRWFFATGLLGSFITLILSPYLSRWTFGNENYTWSFIWLSIVIFFHSISSGQLAILQGMRKLQSLAKASMLGSLLGLVISVPLYYYYGVSGIVPSFIFSGLAAYLLSWYFTKDLKIDIKSIGYHDTVKGGLSMVKLGIAMMFVSFIITIVSFILRSYIGSKGGIDQVGIFQAGYTIITSYFGMIFTSMTTDYYPRLSAINKDDKKVSIEVNRQAEIGMILIGPLVVFIIFSIPFIIKLLYSDKFIGAIDYIYYAVFGVLFQTGSQTLGMVLLAKNRSGIFIYSILSFQTLFLINNIVGYNLYGLKGLGISFSLNMLIHFIGVQIIMFKLYNIKFNRLFYLILATTFFLSFLAFGIKEIESVNLRYSAGALLLMISLAYSLMMTKRVMNIKSLKQWLWKKTVDIRNRLSNKKNIE